MSDARQHPDESFDIVVIGGGHNGLTCAAYLARAGLTVKAAKTFGAPGGEKGISVMVWSADSQKAPQSSPGKRSAA